VIACCFILQNPIVPTDLHWEAVKKTKLSAKGKSREKKEKVALCD
jgi:hypothetical protein